MPIKAPIEAINCLKTLTKIALGLKTMHLKGLLSMSWLS